MAISDTIQSMYENVGNVYDVLELAGADLTNVDKNIENLKQSWEERLLYFLANGTDVVWNNWLPKVNGTGENITLNNTIQAKMDFVYKGNTSQSILPNGYTQVDYITGDGYSYIDTNKTLGNNFKIETSFIHNQQTSGEQPIGSTWVQSFQWFNLYISSNNQLRFYASGNHTTSNPTLTLGSINTVSYSRNSNNWVGVLNGETVTFDTNIQTSNPTTFKILARGDNALGSYISIYRLKLFENNILTMDLIPCYRNSDNVIGMYDIVNNQFLTNAGTGNFTYGSVAPTPECPIPVNVVTGDNEVKVEGKNLAYTGWAEDFVSRINYSPYAKLETKDNRNCLKWNAAAGYGAYDTKYMFKTNWKENTQYSMSFDIYSTSTAANICFEYTDGTAQATGTTKETWTHKKITSASGKTIKYIRAIYSGGDCYIDLDTFMVYEGTDDANYVPYQSQTNPINLGSMELCKIGDYQDYIAKRTGKNLLDESYYNDSSLYTKSGSYFAFVELPDSFKTKFYVNMSVKGTNQNLVFGFIDTMSGVFSGGIRVLNNGTLNSNVECDFTNAEHVYLGIGNASTIDINTDIARIFDNYNIMVSITSGEPYEPYGTGWYKYSAIGKVVLDGSESWIGYTTLDNDTTSWFQRVSLDDALVVLAISNSYLYNDYFSIYNCYSSTNTNAGLCYHTDKKIQVRFPTSLLSDTSSLATRVASFKTWLASNNVSVYYILATPTITPITDATLINQLEAIKLSYNEQTNISQTNTDKPFILDVTALKDLDVEDTTPALTTNRELLFTQPPVSENFINNEDDNSILEETINEEEPNIEDDNREEEEPVDFFEKEIINNDEEQEEIPTEPIEIDNGQR